MGTIISLGDDAHDEAQKLLPWYANGTLADSEHARVAAHLEHCADCRADLDAQVDIASASQPLDVETGWADMRTRMAGTGVAAAPAPWVRRRIPIAWAIGIQAVAAALIVAVMLPRHDTQPAAFHALGSAPVAATGNLVVMFAPGTGEAELRASLTAAGARIVDGPTATGAYVLRVADAARATALERLHANAHVALAEPIDASAAR